ncbi:DNA translocase FtsK [Virgibacillus halodenitrificans]|uniref:DNA translocase FtsK n=1 Tax=Virgibacillus halodenitrificans TaxID=1482 RepID=A0AAC9IZH7_VIRHA|nr:DNA translocase FtsK [Virgibacillus halodenitrificans]APC47988.1 DNA translocase FtsK [Virgibacillus halodenitrificans]
MWQRWKDKIKSFFTEEIEEQEYIEEQKYVMNNSRQQHQPEARMVYRYPERKSFRFPVIPDDSKKMERNTEPKRKRNTERNIDVEKQKPKPSTESSIRKIQPSIEKRKAADYERKSQSTTSGWKSRESGNKVYKKDSQPFTPTEVPSPIYGFQPRKQEKIIEDVPAFQRKKEKLVEETNLSSHIEPNHKVDTYKESENYLHQLDEPQELIQLEEDNLSIDQSHREIEVEEKLETESELIPETETETVSPLEESEKKETATAKSNSQQEKRENKESKHVPFNVMMTPRDKKNLFDKHKKTQESSKTIKKEVAIPHYLLNDPVVKNSEDHIWVEQQKELLEQTLKHFNVRAKVVNATQGPSVTRFEVQPELGVKVSKVKNLSDDLKLNMAAKDIRIEAPIPGRNTIGIEIPNLKAEMVGLQSIFDSEEFSQSSSPLTIALGLSIEGKPLITNIQKMPHGLIAGATGSGKSVCINTILISLIYKASHEDVKFMLIDPKMVELAPYNGIPHLVSPVITDVKAATAALKWAVSEMEDRYEKFVQEGVRDIERYNQKVKKQGRAHEKMPYIVIVIDELADLMMVSPQDVEDSISRIAQKARACGIHLLLATQRPSVDVITGLIKANIPTRIAFSVSSQVDSRTILDTSGAEKLLGKGDMLFIENGTGKSIRLQGPFVSDDEIERVTNFARNIAEPNYLFEQEQLLEQITMDEEEDELLQEAIDFIVEHNSASTSLLQRHFKIGYNRAARLIDTLEQRGMISGQNGSKPREVLITNSQLDEIR